MKTSFAIMVGGFLLATFALLFMTPPAASAGVVVLYWIACAASGLIGGVYYAGTHRE